MDSTTSEHPLSVQEAIPPKWLYGVLYACFLISGAAGPIYQIGWMKALVQVKDTPFLNSENWSPQGFLQKSRFNIKADEENIDPIGPQLYNDRQDSRSS
ncbi:MAG: hypothetical protein GY809_15095 [Planctomycetes bacterium]|nr:hypothetical protein [Planctomycetota bacterium]